MNWGQRFSNPMAAEACIPVLTARPSSPLLEHKFRRNGLFLLDEPEAALSPQRQLAFLVLMHDTLRQYKDAQFIISTHSPVLLGYPEAQILSFDSSPLRWIDYEETAPLQIVRYFPNNREDFLKELFAEPRSLFDENKTQGIAKKDEPV